METKKYEEIITNELPKLEQLIKERLGCDIELNIKLTSEYNNRKGGLGFEITSGNIKHLLGNTLVNTMFSNIYVYMFGSINVESQEIWFNPSLKYEHITYGRNGTNFIWDLIGFSFIDEKWLECGCLLEK